MKINRRLIANIVEIVVGIVLVVCGYAGILDSYWSGMGTALILIGFLMLLKQIRYRTNQSYRENMDVEANDERNKYLRSMAWSWAGYFFVIISAIASIVLKILHFDQLSQFAGGGVCLIIVLFWVSYMILRKKF